MSSALRALASRCTGCGLCDVAFTAYADAARHHFRGPSDLARRFSRSDTGLGDLAETLASIDRGALAVSEAACPERVPLVALADALAERAAHLRGSPADADLPRPRHHPG